MFIFKRFYMKKFQFVLALSLLFAAAQQAQAIEFIPEMGTRVSCSETDSFQKLGWRVTGVREMGAQTVLEVTLLTCNSQTKKFEALGPSLKWNTLSVDESLARITVENRLSNLELVVADDRSQLLEQSAGVISGNHVLFTVSRASLKDGGVIFFKSKITSTILETGASFEDATFSGSIFVRH